MPRIGKDVTNRKIQTKHIALMKVKAKERDPISGQIETFYITEKNVSSMRSHTPVTVHLKDGEEVNITASTLLRLLREKSPKILQIDYVT